MRILIIAGFVFGVVKSAFALLEWLTKEPGDEVYRRHLNSLRDSLNKASMYEVAFVVVERIRSRLRLASPRTFVVSSLFLIFFIVLTNYASLLISLSVMAKDNPNFAFEDSSIPAIAWALFSELGFFGSQQMFWLLGGTSLSAVLTLFLSRKSLLTTARSSTTGQLAVVVLMQVGILLLAGALTVTFLFVSVVLYDTGSNTETQQYLYTQTVRMLYHRERPIEFVVLLNTLVSAFPSTLFLMLFLGLAVLKLMPDFVRRGLMHIVRLVTTDKKPVLSQLGSFFGAISGFTAALLTLLKE